MTTPENPQVDELLAEGIQAARLGNKTKARQALEQVVSLDQYSEKGWFWLASVVETNEEKRTCLGNVIVINPDNQRARRMLEQLESGAGSPQPEAPALVDDRAALGMDGSSRSPVIIAGGLALLALIAIIAIVVVVMGGGDDDDDGNTSGVIANNTLAAPQTSGGTDPTPAPPSGDQNDALLAIPSSTPSQTPTGRPPTWTPIPSATTAPEIPPTMFPAAPASVSGQIIMRAGSVPGDTANQPIVIIKPDGSSRRTIANEGNRGHAPSLSPDGTRYAYVKYAPGTRELLLQIDNLQGTDPLPASTYWANNPLLPGQDMPNWSPDGEKLALVAVGMGAAYADLYMLELDNRSGDPDALTRLTEDNAIESWPAFAPDNERIVYVADLTQLSLDGGPELRTIEIASGTITDLTSNGQALLESAPDWSPNGTTIVFHAHDAADPSGDTDIYTIPASGGEPTKLFDSDASDIQPRYSPDGRYIVFSSNRGGTWDVFIYEIASKTIYQVTNERVTNIANDWSR